jgi:hypothetical protein
VWIVCQMGEVEPLCTNMRTMGHRNNSLCTCALCQRPPKVWSIDSPAAFVNAPLTQTLDHNTG